MSTVIPAGIKMHPGNCFLIIIVALVSASVDYVVPTFAHKSHEMGHFGLSWHRNNFRRPGPL